MNEFNLSDRNSKLRDKFLNDIVLLIIFGIMITLTFWSVGLHRQAFILISFVLISLLFLNLEDDFLLSVGK